MKHKLLTDENVLEYLIDSPQLCEQIASHLEIQADGGDSPGEYVKWAIGQIILSKINKRKAWVYDEKTERILSKING